MGLPLFVAPVESDVARKSAYKHATTSPPRSTIRRTDRAADQERRNVSRRAAVRIFGPVQRTLSTINQERPLPWIESSAAPDNAAARDRLSAMQESIREMARHDTRRNQRMEDHMATVFGNNWHELDHDSTASQDPETDFGWWSLDPPGRARRPRVVSGQMLTPISSRFTRSPDNFVFTPNSPPAATENTAQGDGSVAQERARPAHRSRNESDRRGNQRSRRSTGVDGLGDRERSLSPQGWDTLFTTLAPDPQPPSLTASFSSVAGTQTASQSTVQPSRGNSRVPEGFDDSPIDPACDSECNQSDQEEPSAVQDPRRYFARLQRREHLRHLRMREAQLREQANNARLAEQANNRTDGTSEGSNLQRSSRTGRENNEAPNGPERQALSGVPMPDVRTNTRRWISRILAAASPPESPERTREARPSSLSMLINHPGEEDYSGMQHIVRNLARREDIPEEWWAEAGLSRTLSRQGTN